MQLCFACFKIQDKHLSFPEDAFLLTIEESLQT